MGLGASSSHHTAGGAKNHSTLAWHPWGLTACPHTPHHGPKWGSLQEGEAQAGRAHLFAPAQASPTPFSPSSHLHMPLFSRPQVLSSTLQPLRQLGLRRLVAAQGPTAHTGGRFQTRALVCQAAVEPHTFQFSSCLTGLTGAPWLLMD